MQKEKPNPAATGPNLPRGSFQCENFKSGKKCDTCSHMKDGINFIYSEHFKTKIPIRGHLVHEHYSKTNKDRWFIYSILDKNCSKTYIGSTTNVTSRWAAHKSDCNHKRGHKSGLSKHHELGCPGDVDQNKSHLELTLLDYMDVTGEELQQAGHKGGPGCICKLCAKLKRLEDRWIMKVGSYFYPSGLNSRDEIQQKARTEHKKGNFGS